MYIQIFNGNDLPKRFGQGTLFLRQWFTKPNRSSIIVNKKKLAGLLREWTGSGGIVIMEEEALE